MKQSVFVTGATNGTGYAIAIRYASEGYDVFVTSRDGERAQAAADRIAAEHGVFAKGFALDIRDEARVIEVFNEIDRTERFIETVVLNAAWYLGSDESKNITGAELIVDGGMSCQLYPRKLNEWKAVANRADE